MTLIDLNKISAIVFDMDGTLVDNIPFHQQSWLQLLHDHDIKINESAFAAQNHGTGPEMIRRFFGSQHSDEEVIALWQTKEAIYRALYSLQIKPIDGLQHLLAWLKERGIQIALATMGTTENIDLVLDGLSIRQYFSCIVKGDDVSKGKPHPEVYLKAAQQLGLEPGRLLAVEDSFGGITSALEAGLQVIGITTSYSKQLLLENGAGTVIDNFNDMIGLLSQKNT